MDKYIMSLSKAVKSHDDAKNKTIFYLKQKYKLMIRPEYPILLNNGYRHKYDIVGFVNDDELVFYDDDSVIEIKIPIRKFTTMSDRDLVYSEYKELLDNHVMVVVEIDNLTSHSHTEHQIADGIAKDNALKTFNKNMQFIRLLKEEVNGQEHDMMKYFADNIDTAMANII